MGGNVIYLPKTPDFGSSLGEGVSGGLSQFTTREMEIQQKQRKFQHVVQGIGALKNAGSREKAFEIMTSGNLQFDNIEEMNAARRMIDDMYPPKDTTPLKVTAYDQTGAETHRYVPQGEVTKLNTPEGVTKVFGEGASMTRPSAREQLYKDLGNGTFTSTRVAPIDQKQPGEYTKSELELAMRAHAEGRQTVAAERSAKAAEQSAAHEQRKAGTDEIASGLAMSKNAQMTLANAIGIKHTVHLDGSISIDAEADSEKAKAWYAALPKIVPATKALKGDSASATINVLNEIGYKPKEAEKPFVPVTKPDRSLGERIHTGLIDAADIVTGKTVPDPTKVTPTTKQAEYRTAEDVKAAFVAKKIDQATAAKILKEKFGYK